jgi:Carboxypeptidase regulatory-like domain
MGSPMTGVVIAFAFLLTAQAPSTTGVIAGCVSDTTQPLPRATITATGAGVKRTTTGDASGCYELANLSPGSYRVTARLRGFNNDTRDRVVVTAATVTQLDFTTRPSPICECIRPAGPTLAEQWNYADVVVHARLSESEPGPAARSGYYRHTATVLNALKLPSAGVLRGPIFVLQNQEGGRRGPCDVGQEVVLFLKSWDGDFAITDDNPGLVGGDDDPPAIAFLIQNGRIAHAPPGFERYVGRSVDKFLNELRALSRRRQ